MSPRPRLSATGSRRNKDVERLLPKTKSGKRATRNGCKRPAHYKRQGQETNRRNNGACASLDLLFASRRNTLWLPDFLPWVNRQAHSGVHVVVARGSLVGPKPRFLTTGARLFRGVTATLHRGCKRANSDSQPLRPQNTIVMPKNPSGAMPHVGWFFS